MFQKELSILVLCAVSVAWATKQSFYAPQTDSDQLDVNYEDNEDDIGKVNILPGSTKCYCAQDYNLCACCDSFDIPKLKLNNTGCFELEYIPQALGVSLIFEIDNHVLMNKTVSARNPPPVCHDIPDFSFAALCIQLYNLDIYQKQLTGCARGIAELEGREIYKHNIGCFHLPL